MVNCAIKNYHSLYLHPQKNSGNGQKHIVLRWGVWIL